MFRLQEPLIFKSQQQYGSLFALLDATGSVMDQITFIQQAVDLTVAADVDMLKQELASSRTQVDALHPMYQRLSVQFSAVATVAEATRHLTTTSGDVHIFQEVEFLALLKEKYAKDDMTAAAHYRKCLKLLHMMVRNLQIKAPL